MAAALLAPLSIIGAVMHIAAHAVGKITLFFAAGAIYTEADVRFMQGMIAHHAQAIHMSRMAAARERLVRAASASSFAMSSSGISARILVMISRYHIEISLQASPSYGCPLLPAFFRALAASRNRRAQPAMATVPVAISGNQPHTA